MSDVDEHRDQQSSQIGIRLDDDERSRLLSVLTRNLVWLMLALLAVVAVVFFYFVPNRESGDDKTYLTFMVFALGLTGGFVSIQQRLDRIGDNELRHLTSSVFSILLVPVYGGVFALVLHVVFVAELVTGAMFPRYWTPTFPHPPDADAFFEFFRSIIPISAEDTARMIFWSFAAGFSERLVPQVIRRTARSIHEPSEARGSSSNASDSSGAEGAAVDEPSQSAGRDPGLHDR